MDEVTQMFDLLKEQNAARECMNTKDLYQQWDRICSMYDRGEIGRGALYEIRDTIFGNIHSLEQMKTNVNSQVTIK